MTSAPGQFGNYICAHMVHHELIGIRYKQIRCWSIGGMIYWRFIPITCIGSTSGIRSELDVYVIRYTLYVGSWLRQSILALNVLAKIYKLVRYLTNN